MLKPLTAFIMRTVSHSCFTIWAPITFRHIFATMGTVTLSVVFTPTFRPQ